jgi:outer membrane protein OmpA-like peptidoglycan-associated protein
MSSFFLHAYEKIARTTSIAFLIPSVLLAATPSAEAQDLYAFQDYGALNSTMTKIAAETTDGFTISDPCNLHIISIDGASILFPIRMLAAMNKVLAQTIVGSERFATCSVSMHELTHEASKVLIARERSRAVNAHFFQIIYIPIADKVVAYASFRNSTGQIVGKGKRFDMPVVKDQEVLTTAAFLPKPKVRTKLLTEVHFDSASVNITYVGNQKITKAIEAIKDQNPVEIRIFGFTDTLGDPISNKATAQGRADNVARAIREAGIDIPLVVEGRGEGVGPYQTPDGLSEPLNRCVGIIAVFHDPAE